MPTICSEITWLRGLLEELSVSVTLPILLYTDNINAIQITSNIIFHERTKHIEVDYHFIHDKFMVGEISLPHVASENQIVDIFTKAMN